MTRSRRRQPSLLVLAIIGAISTLCSGRRPPLGQSIILINIDGYGAALLNNSKSEHTNGFHELAAKGVKAEYLKGTFPTLAIPSWHSFATGLYTENHGMTMNSMYDPNTTRVYEGGQGQNDSDWFWWKGRPAPLWYTAGKAGIDVNCFWFSYCHQAFGDLAVLLPKERRADVENPEQTDAMPLMFDEMVTKIRRYQPYRKQIFLIRYAGVDTALRLHGPASNEVEQALAKVDLHIHELQEKMEASGLFESTNLIVMSEHGLARVVEEEQFYLEECLSDYTNVKMVVSSKSMLIIHTKPGAEDSVFFELKVCDQWANMGDYDDDVNPVEVYRSNALPENLHIAQGRFLGNIIILTKPGTTVITRELTSVPAKDIDLDKEREQMADGWDNNAEAMRGIFLARGPAFKMGETVGPIELVDVYNILLNIVGLDAGHPNNGSWERVEGMLTDDWEERATPRTGSAPLNFFILFSPVLLARLLF